MASTNKTTNIGLNSWIGTDLIKREDFNADNVIIDNKIKENADNIGDKTQLETTNKNSVVNAVNETVNKIDLLSTQELESTGYGVISGLTISAQTTPDMTVNVASGIVHMANGIRLAPIGNSALAITAADTTNPRVDIIYVKSDSTIGYTAGTPATTPTAPDIPTGAFLLAQISVSTGATTITSENITDKRKMKVTSEYLDNTINEHKADNMPHKFTDSVTSKTYKYGFSVSDGKVSFNYEEVV